MASHRHLRWTSPHMKGADVGRLQKAIGVPVDQDYGAVTAAAVRHSKDLLGFADDDLHTGASEFYQQILYHEIQPPSDYVKRATAAQNAAKAAATQGSMAVDWLDKYVGDTEIAPGHGYGTNRNPAFLDKWCIAAGHQPYKARDEDGWAWCGVTIHAAFLYGAGVDLDNRMISVDWISAAATAGTGGLYRVSIGQLKKGNLITLFGNEHVAFVREDYVGIGPILTREGNTSFANGNQSDGGCLTDKSRDPGDVTTPVAVRVVKK